jgi:hypothetical protein
MANRDLLKEAIADAKSVKEAAIANAKAALEEAFTPYLKEKFTAKLAEMEKEDMDEAKEEMDENYSEEKMEEKMSNPVMRKGLKGDDTEEKRTEKMREEEETMDEMDLDELLAELDEEMGKDKDMEENLNEDARTDAEEEGYEDGMEDEKEDEEEDEIDLEDMTEDELKDLIEDVIEDMVRAGELEAGESFESDEDEEEDIDIDMEDEEEMVSERAYYGKNKGDKPRKSTAKEKDELLKEEEDMMDEGLLDKIKDIYNDKELLAKLITVDGKKMSIKDLLQLAASGAAGGMKKSGAEKGPFNTEGVEMDEAKEEMDEMKKEIEELASTLAETKLLNAKLLYSNKIFRAKNLNETQKVKVLEAFDKASSVKEAKLIYETLTTVKETKAAVNESVRGMASKAAGMAPEKKPILEVNDQFARWQVLAGIKRN